MTVVVRQGHVRPADSTIKYLRHLYVTQRRFIYGIAGIGLPDGRLHG